MAGPLYASVVEISRGLPFDAETALNPPAARLAIGRHELRRDHAERLRLLQVQRGIVEIDVVEYVEEIHREDEADAFTEQAGHRMQGCALAQRQVQVPHAKAIDGMATTITPVHAQQHRTVALGHRAGVGKQIQPRALVRGIACRTEAAGRSDAGVHTRAEAVDVAGRDGTDGVWEDAAATPDLVAFDDEFGQSALGNEDARGVPAADELVQRLMAGGQAVARPEGQLVVEIRVEHVPAIEEGRAVA